MPPGVFVCEGLLVTVQPVPRITRPREQVNQLRYNVAVRFESIIVTRIDTSIPPVFSEVLNPPLLVTSPVHLVS